MTDALSTCNATVCHMNGNAGGSAAVSYGAHATLDLCDMLDMTVGITVQVRCSSRCCSFRLAT